jgi:hypothetical protein
VHFLGRELTSEQSQGLHVFAVCPHGLFETWEEVELLLEPLHQRRLGLGRALVETHAGVLFDVVFAGKRASALCLPFHRKDCNRVHFSSAR